MNSKCLINTKIHTRKVTFNNIGLIQYFQSLKTFSSIIHNNNDLDDFSEEKFPKVENLQLKKRYRLCIVKLDFDSLRDVFPNLKSLKASMYIRSDYCLGILS